MTGNFFRQLAQVVPTTFGAFILVFVVMRILPGDAAAAMLGSTATPDAIAALRDQLGLNRPLWEQLLSYLWGLLRLDFGQSMALHTPVSGLLADALPHTVLLTIGGTLVGTLVGVPLGVLAALKRGTWIDYLASTGAILGISVPVFVWGILLLLMFSLEWPIFPSSGGGNTPLEMLRALVLPSLATGLLLTGLVSRISRASVLQVLAQDYVRTARAKGVPEWAVLSTHVLRNALIPILTVIGLNIGTLLSGAVIAETVFSRPGIGRVALEAILARDYPVIQGVVIVSVVAVVLINLVIDLLYGVVDPRVRA
jgi:ABC-type dipeptide/oligopeptide/nickel transport system permease component